MRLFTAICPDEPMRRALAGIQTELRREGWKGNYTKEENLHLTLAFIGEYPDPARVLDAMEELSFAPFPITLNGMGRFGDLVWAGLEESEALFSCVRRLRRALSENGVPFDRRRFSPHITLLRRAFREGGPGPGGLSVPRARMEAGRVSLMRSEFGKNGMIYSEIGCIRARG